MSEHEHGHPHEHPREAGRPGPASRVRHLARPHSHEPSDRVDRAMEGSAAGMRVLWISLAVLGVTALVQAVITVASGSVALLGDTLHNAADALTAVPLGIAFLAARRPAPGPPQPLRVTLAPVRPLPAAPRRKAVPAALRMTRAQSTLLRPYSQQIPVCAGPPAPPRTVPCFATAEEAVAWMRAEYAAAADPVMAGLLSPQGLYRRLAKHAGPALASKGIL